MKQYLLLADLFYYPREGYAKRAQEIQSYLTENYLKAAEELMPFTNFVNQTEEIDIQELYVRSFDVQSTTTLDIGYVLFGDDYKRGEILANLNREHQSVGQDCRGELADHLPNILCLISKIKDEELKKELVEEILMPALEKMTNEFNPERVKQKNKLYKKHYKTLIATSERFATIFQHPLKALEIVLKTDFKFPKKIKPIQTTDFLKSVEREMDIEYEHTK